MQKDILVTPEEAADFLCVSVDTLAVWRSTQKVQIPFIKVGNRVRYSTEDLIKFVNSNRKGGSHANES